MLFLVLLAFLVSVRTWIALMKVVCIEARFVSKTSVLMISYCIRIEGEIHTASMPSASSGALLLIRSLAWPRLSAVTIDEGADSKQTDL
jgi:hypothetical protein